MPQPTHEQPKTPPPHQPGSPIHPGKSEPEKQKPDKDEEKEDKEKVERAFTTVSMSAQQFKDVIAAVIYEARKPVRDERAVEQQAQMRERNRMLAKDSRDLQIARYRSCNHMQLPGTSVSGCSCIAWATQDDKVRRGTCQHCGTCFSPKREECLSDEIWQAYGLLIRIPTHPAGNINTVFQSA
jgi:hypothetical protein